MNNPISWVEVPVNNMERAIEFYNHVFKWELKQMEFGNVSMAWFPANQEGGYGATGSLIKNEENYTPSAKAGSLIYFSCVDIPATLNRINEKDGNTLQEKTHISEGHGYMALFTDCEGNRLALHSNS